VACKGVDRDGAGEEEQRQLLRKESSHERPYRAIFNLNASTQGTSSVESDRARLSELYKRWWGLGEEGVRREPFASRAPGRRDSKKARSTRRAGGRDCAAPPREKVRGRESGTGGNVRIGTKSEQVMRNHPERVGDMGFVLPSGRDG
jgi:hypothetical protein